jgi:5-methylcytosine-specific restriction enzyme subunit McrC
LSPDLRERLDTTLYRLHQVSEVELTSRTFRSVQLHRNNRSYRFLLALCRLIHNAGLLTEDAGESQFVDFIRDEKRMRKLFERFVWNFFYREQRQLRPVGNKLDWAGLRGDQESLNLMPGMRTDVRLVSKTRCVVIETKYVPQMLQAYHGKESLRSQHLYQLHTYLSNVVPLGNRRVEGILLYPAVGRKLDVRVELDRFPIRAFALDLDQDWQAIRADLLSLVGTQAPRVSAGRDASLERAEASKKGSYRWPP